MKGRTLALSLLVYLTLDLGNPFMPGAVTFVDGRLEVVDASRPSGIDLPVLDGAAVARRAPGAPAPLAWSAPRPPTGARRRRWWIPARRVVSVAPEPASPDAH